MKEKFIQILANQSFVSQKVIILIIPGPYKVSPSGGWGDPTHYPKSWFVPWCTPTVLTQKCWFCNFHVMQFLVYFAQIICQPVNTIWETLLYRGCKKTNFGFSYRQRDLILPSSGHVCLTAIPNPANYLFLKKSKQEGLLTWNFQGYWRTMWNFQRLIKREVEFPGLIKKK